MLVTKILEGTLTAGQTSISFTDSDIPNSFIRVGCTNSDLFPTEETISGNTLTIKYDAQPSNMGVVVELVKAGMSINDTLTSESAEEALSAKQGKALKDLIDGLGTPGLADLTDVDITSASNDDLLIYDETSEKWVNTSFPNIPADIDDLSDVEITSPTDGQVLKYNNGIWENANESGGGGGSDVYSTTKTEVGKWIDNSKVYRQVFDLGSDVSVANNSWYTTSIPASTIKYIVNARGMRSNGTFFPLMSECESTYITLLAARANAAATVRYLILDFVEN